MQNSRQPSSRKRFLLWGSAILSSLAILKIFPGSKRQRGRTNETVKMLTRDGRLVEIDKKFLVSAGKKVTTEELQQWIANGHTK